MSFAKSFDGMVRDFCRVLSEKYELKEEEVLSVWTGTLNQSAPVKSSSTAPTSSSSASAAPGVRCGSAGCGYPPPRCASPGGYIGRSSPGCRAHWARGPW